MANGIIENMYELGPADESVQPQHLVILLHGLGSNGRDLISLAPMFAQHVPQAVFVSPDAPFICDMVPPGYPDSYQWFSLQSRDPQTMLQGVQTAAPILEAFIEDQCARFRVKPEKCVLAGFSQGTMMSLYTAPRYKERLAGVLGYSGALIGDAGQEGLHKMPVHLVHGEADDVVPVAAWHDAKARLEKAGFEVSGHTTPSLPHSIDQSGIDSGAAFLKKSSKLEFTASVCKAMTANVYCNAQLVVLGLGR